MLHPLIMQFAPEVKNLVLAGEGTAGILFAKAIFDLYSKFKEAQERKKHTEEFIKQTEILRNVDGHLTTIKSNQLQDTTVLSLGSERQKDMLAKVDRIDRGVRDLKLMAGIPDTQTTQIRKEDVNTH